MKKVVYGVLAAAAALTLVTGISVGIQAHKGEATIFPLVNTSNTATIFPLNPVAAEPTIG